VNVRLVFLAITAFWIVMNVLLWRSETRGAKDSDIPLRTVAQRMLEAADSSTLQIHHHRVPIGQLRWTPAVLQDDASATNQLVDDGMVTRRTGYAIDLELNLVAGGGGRQGRGGGRIEFNPDLTWRSMDIRFTEKPMTYEISARAASAVLSLRILQGNDVVFNQNLPLQDPAALLTTLDGSLGGFGLLTPGLLSGLGVLVPTGGANAGKGVLPAGLLRWESRTTELRVSQQRVRAFLVSARFLDKYQGDVWVSRSGELLRVTLPNEIELRDESLPATR